MADKPNRAAEYSGEQLGLVRSACLYVATKLGDLLDDVVIVGRSRNGCETRDSRRIGPRMAGRRGRAGERRAPDPASRGLDTTCLAHENSRKCHRPEMLPHHNTAGQSSVPCDNACFRGPAVATYL